VREYSVALKFIADKGFFQFFKINSKIENFLNNKEHSKILITIGE